MKGDTESCNEKMVLLIAVLLGLASGILRARLGQRSYRSIEVKHIWLVFVAYLPQLFAFYLPFTRTAFPDRFIPAILVGSQCLLLVFAWVNRKLPGFWMLGMGLVCNFLAIALNGGMMPLPPENAQKLLPAGSQVVLEVGKRVGFGKDILLPRELTALRFLGDIFLLPEWVNYPLAFSVGDILISVGAFWLFWQLGGPHKSSREALS
jgi:hypothetical protein